LSLELIVDVRPNGVWLALLREGKLIELHEERGNSDFAVGDIYLGKIRRLSPSLNAAFVDVGYDRDAFLHYLDLGSNFNSLNKYTKEVIRGKQSVPSLQYFKLEPELQKEGKIDSLLSSSQFVMVQVAKEPISSKGPRLSSEITLAGRYMVLAPFSSKISVSQKIRSHEEKKRLKEVMEGLLPKNFGAIIRTVAENKTAEDIQQDLAQLLEKWDAIYKNLKGSNSPKRILGEINTTSSILRDLLNADFSNVHVNSSELFEEISTYVQQIAPGKNSIVKLYDGRIPIFERYGINKQIKVLFGKKVPMPSGGYLIIEHTEAMHVIDVNSGNRKGADGQESNALATNLEAAEEISRILQLRDMGGIICIDFIDLHDRENNRILYDKIKLFMKNDRAKHNIIPPSKFGVVEITRQRVREVTEIETNESCPTCNGSGEIQASILYAEEIENNLAYMIQDRGMKGFSLQVHPYLDGYFKKGGLFRSMQWKWYFKFKTWIPITPNTAFHILEYKFVDKNQEIIPE
jgi:ribonuclease G